MNIPYVVVGYAQALCLSSYLLSYSFFVMIAKNYLRFLLFFFAKMTGKVGNLTDFSHFYTQDKFGQYWPGLSFFRSLNLNKESEKMCEHPFEECPAHKAYLDEMRNIQSKIDLINHHFDFRQKANEQTFKDKLEKRRGCKE